MRADVDETQIIRDAGVVEDPRIIAMGPEMLKDRIFFLVKIETMQVVESWRNCGDDLLRPDELDPLRCLDHEFCDLGVTPVHLQQRTAQEHVSPHLYLRFSVEFAVVVPRRGEKSTLQSFQQTSAKIFNGIQRR